MRALFRKKGLHMWKSVYKDVSNSGKQLELLLCGIAFLSYTHFKENCPFFACLPPFWPLFLTCCPDTFFGSSHFRLAGWFLDFLLVVVTAGRGLCRTLGPQWEGRPLGSFLTSSLTGKDPINLSTIFEPWHFCFFFDFDSSVDSVGDFFSLAFFKDSKRACNYIFLNNILYFKPYFVHKIFYNKNLSMI